MPNLHNLQGVTQTKRENWRTMATKDTCLCEESLIDRSFLFLEIFFFLGGEGGDRVTIAFLISGLRMI